jgi:hypothetical protein
MSRHQGLAGARPLLDLVSYGRRGPNDNRPLLPHEIEFFARTVRRTPEVMVKVLSKGGQDFGAVQRHFDYLSRKGELELETDDGRHVAGDEIQKSLLMDWDLDLEEHRRQSQLAPRARAGSPKLVHKLVFSMPAGTPPDKVLSAVRTVCREEFALKHRHAMVLHTDEPHPHVHVVVKAMGEEGERLNIRKADLRRWRQEFARHLRANGVAANATERAVRGADVARKKDGIYRAARRGQSTHMRNRVTEVAQQLAKGSIAVEPGQERLLATRAGVLEGWKAVSERLVGMGDHQLAAEVRTFARGLGSARTERELLARAMLQQRTVSEMYR